MNNTTTSLTARLAAPAAMAAGVVIAMFGFIQITDSQSGESTTVGIEHLSLAGFSAMLVLLVPVTLFLGRLAGRPRIAGVAVTGQIALALLTVISNVRGEDPSFFAAVAGPSNLLWLGGLIAIAVGLHRGGRLPRLVVVGLPVSWLLTLPLSDFGGAIVAGAYWLAVGWLLMHREPARSLTPEAAYL